MMIIGMSGLAGSGKTTATQILQNHFNLVRHPMAGPLKNMVAALGISRSILDGPASVKEQPLERFGGKSARYAMQTLGTEWGRNCMGHDFWVNQWAATVPAEGCICDDVRFKNEYDKVKEMGGLVIRIVRPGAGVKDGMGAMHASEDLSKVPYDKLITNDGTIAELETNLLATVQFWLEIQIEAEMGRV